MTVAQALLRYLDQQYVERDGVEHKFVAGVLGIFGHGNVLGLGEALEQKVCGLKFVQGHNEQGMVHAAVAYAKQKNRLGMWACTSSIGPGALNMVTAAAGATINRLPVLLLPGDYFADRQPDPVLQQLEGNTDRTASVNDAFKPVSVYWDRITRPEQLIASLTQAMVVLTDPSATGAVTIALPQDVQTESWDFPAAWLERRVWPIRRQAPGLELDGVVDLIRQAAHPLAIAGGGVKYSGAETVLADFAARFHIPVVETQAGKGSLPWNHPWNLGGVGVTGSQPGNALASDADFILAVGTRLTDFTTASKQAFQNPQAVVATININRMDAYKLRAVPLIADARVGLQDLMDRLGRAKYRSAYENDAVADAKRNWDAEVDRWYHASNQSGLTQTEVLGVLNEMLGPDDVIVAAAGSLPGDLHRLWRCVGVDNYHLEYGFSCMGYEVAGALGVKWAQPDRSVFALVGDGSFLLLHSELYTSLQEDTPITIIVLDNQGFGSINALQKAHGSQGFGTEFRRRNPLSGDLNGDCLDVDFAHIGQALGARGLRVTTRDQLSEAILKARQPGPSTVIDVKVLPGTATDSYGGWWRVDVASTSTSADVRRAFDVSQEELKKVWWT
ncbi:MAG: 3D-(3,5/4)-trihydroxycyclohexane-1,2-dione acylhydrolase (decyclizing) [Sulfobacillus acidophilus]|uniref:3D-(3,5/4)-trihydroxycyclohexane-1,2-dione acylhydrolase (Decyclizing) n=1 Tax=Sulfobacillus acidophilus TaxID=53633 RepID=A0A2T2WN17_9FIRM|nr:MAG: 3D-(3,5/4)-trihydroxycyclohexane-1,2-dione acylhydrolase (decyclizing) [Sulfobacillus acidophilus]